MRFLGTSLVVRHRSCFDNLPNIRAQTVGASSSSSPVHRCAPEAVSVNLASDRHRTDDQLASAKRKRSNIRHGDNCISRGTPTSAPATRKFAQRSSSSLLELGSLTPVLPLLWPGSLIPTLLQQVKQSRREIPIRDSVEDRQARQCDARLEVLSSRNRPAAQPSQQLPPT